jgi:hypothetical protein
VDDAAAVARAVDRLDAAEVERREDDVEPGGGEHERPHGDGRPARLDGGREPEVPGDHLRASVQGKRASSTPSPTVKRRTASMKLMVSPRSS